VHIVRRVRWKCVVAEPGVEGTSSMHHPRVLAPDLPANLLLLLHRSWNRKRLRIPASATHPGERTILTHHRHER
jgi:hypothetical protein